MKFSPSIMAAFTRRAAEAITTLFIHHTVMVPTADVMEVDRIDRGRGGFIAIGYNGYCKRVKTNFISRLWHAGSGFWVVQQARPIDVVPAAQYGMNTEGYAIAVGGNYQPGGAPFLTAFDQRCLRPIVDQIKSVQAKCPNLRYLCGHRDVATIMAKRGKNPGDYSTACPGDDLYLHLHDLRMMTGLQVHPELL